MGRPRELVGQVPGRDGALGLQAESGVLGEGMGPSLREGVVWGGREPRCVAVSSDRFYPSMKATEALGARGLGAPLDSAPGRALIPRQ